MPRAGTARRRWSKVECGRRVVVRARKLVPPAVRRAPDASPAVDPVR